MEKSSFFNAVIDQNGTPDRSYLAEDFARYFASFIGNGVFPNPSSQLQVVAVDNNMQIRIRQGKAWINGYFYENTDYYIFKLDPADGVLNRIDRVVLRLDFLERKIKAVVKKGKYGSTPVASALQRDADAYEIALADIYVRAGAISITQSDITDLRLNSNVCGIVHGVVDQVDTTAIFNQFQSWYSQTKETYDKDIAMWTKDKKEDFDKWYSTNTQAFLNQFQTWFENTEIWEKDFNNWFETLKDKLDGNIAAKLTKDVEQLKKDVENIDIPVKSVNEKTGAVVLNAEDVNAYNKTEIDNKLGNIKVAVTKIKEEIITDMRNSDLCEFLSVKVLEENIQGITQSLSTTGYRKLAGGLILQWGEITALAAKGYASGKYPIEFPGGCMVLSPSVEYAGGVLNITTAVQRIDRCNYNIYVRDSEGNIPNRAVLIKYIAIGY